MNYTCYDYSEGPIVDAQNMGVRRISHVYPLKNEGDGK